jgi:hypothetical protein
MGLYATVLFISQAVSSIVDTGIHVRICIQKSNMPTLEVATLIKDQRKYIC